MTRSSGLYSARRSSIVPMISKIYLILVLMCRTEKIKHNLHWIESSERNLHKESIPLTHSTIPKTRKLESLKLATLIALRRDETCILIHIL